jgi:hypothetical protein
MDSSRRLDGSFRHRSASRDCGGLRAVPSLTSRRTAASKSAKATLDRLDILAGILLIGLGAALCARIV